MLKYIGKRLLLGVLVLFGVVVVSFIITQLLPGDPAMKWAGLRATDEQIAQARIELGLDEPITTQFAIYCMNLLEGDLGNSYRSHRPVADELSEYIPATFELVLWAMIIGLLLGPALGILSAKFKDKLPDHLVRVFSIGIVSLPSFWVALAFQLVFFGILGISPLGGRLSQEISLFYEIPDITGMLSFDALFTGNWVVFWDALWHMALPVLTVALYPIGNLARLTRSSMLEVMGENYITAERSYGIRESYIWNRFGLKNILGSTATASALVFAYAMTNTFLVESIFSWPGIGKYVSDAILGNDYPAIMGVTLFSAFIYLIANLIADLVIALDPRVRIYGKGA